MKLCDIGRLVSLRLNINFFLNLKTLKKFYEYIRIKNYDEKYNILDIKLIYVQMSELSSINT